MSEPPRGDDRLNLDLDSAALKSRALRGSALTAGAQLAKVIIQVGSQVILARLLFPEDFGVVAMAAPVVAFVQLFGSFGMGEAIMQRPRLDQALVSSLYWLTIAAGLAIAGLVVITAPVAAWIYSEPRVLPLMMVLAGTVPLGALAAVQGAILYRRMQFGAMLRNDLASSITGIAATIAAALAGLGYWSLVIGQLVQAGANTILIWISCGWWPSRPKIVAEAWEQVRFGANMMGANFATFVTSSGDNVIIGTLNGAQALGIYDRSYRLVAQPIGQMLSPIGSVTLPLLSRLHENPTEYRNAYLNALRIIIMLTFPVMLVCVVNADEVVLVLLGPRWAAAAPTFAWIAVGGLASGIYTSLTWLYVSQGKIASYRRYASVGAVLSLASFALGSLWGVVGVAACAALVFGLVTTPLMLHGATRGGPVEASDILRSSAPYALISALVATALILVARNDAFVPLIEVALLFAVSFGLFVSLAAMLGPERRLLVFGASKAWHSLRGALRFGA